MNASLRWLNDYLGRPVDADEADRVLTIAGFPVEAREDLADDVMIDFEVTSNRGDCLSHVGLARELAAATGRTLKLPEIEINESGAMTGDMTSVLVEAADACPVYTARVITGVKIGPSPAWLTERLEAVGLRPVNNVVDVTNFVLHELGQPLHAFDMRKLAERRIVVRRATAGEMLTAIDGSKHKLRDDMLVIADAEKPVAVAGVMGGCETEVTDETVDVLLESAIFEPLSVRTTSRALKLASDSSFRFERKVDPVGVERASERAAQLIVELAGGALATGVVRVGADVPEPTNVSMRPARCEHLLGVSIEPGTMVDYLAALELRPQVTGDVIECTVPSFRHDLTREVDLIEEVARLYGFDRVPQEPTMRVVVRPPQHSVEARRRLGEVLCAHGYHEAITFNWIDEQRAKPFLPAGCDAVRIEGDSRKAEPCLKPSTLPALLACRKANQDAGNAGVKLFETAAVFCSRGGQYEEHRKLGLVADAAHADTAVRELRGTLEELGEQLVGSDALTFAPIDDPRFDAAASVSMVGGEALGVFGKLSSALQDAYDLQTSVVVAELELEPLISAYPPATVVSELPSYPAIERDLSIIIDESVRWEQVAEQIEAASPALMVGAAFIGAYRGKQVGTGRKSVTFRMTFRDPEKTLRHDEVDPQVAAVVERMTSRLGAELRA